MLMRNVEMLTQSEKFMNSLTRPLAEGQLQATLLMKILKHLMENIEEELCRTAGLQ